jgi:hypothetical protein
MSRIFRWTLTLAVVLVALCASLGSAAAAPRAADTPPPDNARLERTYKAERMRLREMERHFQQAGAYAGEVARMIARLKQRGVDTMPLDRALAAFRGRMLEARGHWERARDALTAHAGFDAQGHVTNAAQALATVTAAHNQLQQAAAIGEVALRDLRAAVAAFRNTHR